MPGLASTALLVIIFSWNEAFWSINLSNANAQPLNVHCLLFEPGRALLGQAVSRIFSRGRSDHGARLADAKAAGASSHLRRGEIRAVGDAFFTLRRLNNNAIVRSDNSGIDTCPHDSGNSHGTGTGSRNRGGHRC